MIHPFNKLQSWTNGQFPSQFAKRRDDDSFVVLSVLHPEILPKYLRVPFNKMAYSLALKFSPDRIYTEKVKHMRWVTVKGFGRVAYMVDNATMKFLW